MGTPQFYLREGGGFIRHFDESHELFSVFGTAVASIFTSDVNHPKCMRVSANALSGVDAYVSGVRPNSKYTFEAAYRTSNSSKWTFNVYDNVGGATIWESASVISTDVWRNVYKTMTTPANCSIVRIRIKKNTGAEKIRVDDLYFQGNALLRDPSRYGVDFPEEAAVHKTADGRKKKDVVAQHVGFTMNFPNVTASCMRTLARAAKSENPAYFDDGNVFVMTEYGTIYTSKTYVMTAAASSGKDEFQAYKCATTAERPVASDAFEQTEFTSTQYRTLASNDGNAVTNNLSAGGRYGYFKINYGCTTFATNSQVKSFRVNVMGDADDKSDVNADGLELFVWDGTQYSRLDRSRKSAKKTLTFSSSNQEIARKMVDTTNNKIRLAVKTRVDKDTSASLYMHLYYVEITVNRNLSRIIPLKNKAIEAGTGGIVEVKNMTSGDLLVHEQATTGYMMTDDRKGVRVTSDQSVSSLIRVKYEQYYEVAFEQVAEPEVYGGDISDPRGVGAVRMQTLEPIG